MKTALCILFLAAAAYSQPPTTCDLEMKDAPTIRGLSLGMPKESVDKMLPRKTNTLFGYDLQSRPEFKNVRALELAFRGGTLSMFNLKYDKSVQWDSLQEFTANISRNLNLPAGAWLPHSDIPGQAVMVCRGGFSVSANYHLNEIEVLDFSGLPIPETKQEQQRRKQDFKP